MKPNAMREPLIPALGYVLLSLAFAGGTRLVGLNEVTPEFVRAAGLTLCGVIAIGAWLGLGGR